MAGNKSLGRAKADPEDEYFTTYSTIETECQYYTKHFKDAIVFCNCDDPTWSNFWNYFHTNFGVFGLKKLVSTHFESDGSRSYKMEYTGGDDLNVEAGVKTMLQEDGDFRSEECVELLKECTICCTNPPFSLLREYMKLLIDCNVKFLIIGAMTAVHYKEIFPLIKNNRIWLGYEHPKKFIKPDGGMKTFGNILWFTNLDIEKRHEKFFKPEETHVYYEGNEELYPVYYNYNAIDVGAIEMIPIDYTGEMGVPDTIIDKYNPDEFELIGLGRDGEGITVDRKIYYTTIKALNPNGRPSHIGFFTKDGGAKEPYSRIIIRNRNPVPRAVDEAM